MLTNLPFKFCSWEREASRSNLFALVIWHMMTPCIWDRVPDSPPFLRITLKTWEWPGDEAKFLPYEYSSITKDSTNVYWIRCIQYQGLTCTCEDQHQQVHDIIEKASIHVGMYSGYDKLPYKSCSCTLWHCHPSDGSRGGNRGPVPPSPLSC